MADMKKVYEDVIIIYLYKREITVEIELGKSKLAEEEKIHSFKTMMRNFDFQWFLKSQF